MPFNYRPYIFSNPEICVGESVIERTRVTLLTMLASLADGMSVEVTIADFPSLSLESVKAPLVAGTFA
jgi:uncharacterized protein (DUF433 family)